MAAAIKGYKMTLIMPDNMSAERIASMKAYGAEIILTPAKGSMEGAIDLARSMEAAGRRRSWISSPIRTIRWRTISARARKSGATRIGAVSHFVSSMGTTGTIMGVSRYLKEKSPRANCRCAAARRIANTRYPPLAKGISAENLRTGPDRPDNRG